jgi:L-lactate dehydrogenase (cytochrome)
MDLDTTHPALADLARTARRRLPRFVWEYLDSGTGADAARDRNRAALDRVTLVPAALAGHAPPDLSVTLMGRRQALPFGFAPVGMSGLIRPGAERILARLAAAEGIPYCLSTVAADTPERVGPKAGEQGWFQLYAPGDEGIRRDLLARAAVSGFHTLVLTADVPVASRRERQRRARLTNPMRITPRTVWQAATCPGWAAATLGAGIPRLRTLERYADASAARGATAHIGYMLRTAPDRAMLAAIRAEWPGRLVVKGVLDPAVARAAADAGADAIWVSNHGGRQFDASPAGVDMLPAIRAAVPGLPLICDGGIASGTDILRMLACGADFVMLGRAIHWGLAAFGAAGAAHVVHVLREGLKADLGQLGRASLAGLADRLVPEPPCRRDMGRA